MRLSLKSSLMIGAVLSLGGGIYAYAITGPLSPVGSGSGAIGVDSAYNLSVGTSTTQSDTKFLITAPDTSASNYALRITQPNLSPLFTVRNDGKLGIMTAPNSSYALNVNGDTNITGNLVLGGALTGGSISPSMIISGVFGTTTAPYSFRDKLGIGTSTQVNLPEALSVYGNAWLKNSAGNVSYFKITDGGAARTWGLAASTTGNFSVMDMGTGQPVITVEPGAPASSLYIAANGTVSVGGGNGKLSVGTIDPVYSIGGKQYATYGPGMVGVKEEITGTAQLRCVRTVCSYTMDLSRQAEGSDLWLFAKTTNLAKRFDSMSVLLSPGFDGRAWYRKDASRNRLTIYGDDDGEVSYRLTAPRFDSGKWPNTAAGESGGLVVE